MITYEEECKNLLHGKWKETLTAFLDEDKRKNKSNIHNQLMGEYIYLNNWGKAGPFEYHSSFRLFSHSLCNLDPVTAL